MFLSRVFFFYGFRRAESITFIDSTCITSIELHSTVAVRSMLSVAAGRLQEEQALSTGAVALGLDVFMVDTTTTNRQIDTTLLIDKSTPANSSVKLKLSAYGV